jgi:phosphohistidine phosphatase
MAMYFVQHGLAMAKEADPKCSLSAEGRKEVECVSAHLRKMGLTVRIVFHSGKARARDTALIFAGQIGDGKIEELFGMAQEDDVAEFAAGLKDDAMHVGHLPHMEKLVSYLVTGREDSGVVKFVNGGVVCVEKVTTTLLLCQAC